MVNDGSDHRDLVPILGSAGAREHFRRHGEVSAVHSFDWSRSWRTDDKRRTRATKRLLDNGVPVPEILARGRRWTIAADAGNLTVASTFESSPPDTVLESLAHLALKVARTELQPFEARSRTRRRFSGVVERALTKSPGARTAWSHTWRQVADGPWLLGHGDFHSRNVVISDANGSYSLVDLQDVGPAPYTLDLALLSVDPNYDEILLTADRVAGFIRTFDWTRGQAEMLKNRDIEGDVLLGQVAQLIRLTVVCHKLFATGRGEPFRVESVRSLTKLQALAPASLRAVVATLSTMVQATGAE